MNNLFWLDEIKIIQIKLTKVCNKQCSYCCAGNGVYDTRWDEYSEDYSQLIKSLTTLIEKFNINFSSDLMIEINGGEPLLMLDRVLEIINLFKPYANKFVIFTNGELFTNEIDAQLFDNVEFNIGFDTTQKSVFRFNEIQRSIITRLATEKKLRGVFVVDGYNDIPLLAEHIQAIIELTQCMPTIEYNAFKVDELIKDESLIYQMKDQLNKVTNLIKTAPHRNCECKCGIINVLPNGEITTCLESLTPDMNYNACRQFVQDNCSTCKLRNSCSNCLLSINQYKGKPFCKMKNVLGLNV